MNNMNEIMKVKRTAAKTVEHPTTIVSKGGRVWNVIEIGSIVQGGRRKFNRSVYTVACSRCGFQVTAPKAEIQKRKTCPGCTQKPAALKMDHDGHCISICELGMVEFIREYQQEHSVSEREAVRHFIDTARVHLSKDDPVVDSLTEESVRSTVRRATGKKKPSEKQVKVGAGSPTIHGSAEQCMQAAISTLNLIAVDDPGRDLALLEVGKWCHVELRKSAAAK